MTHQAHCTIFHIVDIGVPFFLVLFCKHQDYTLKESKTSLAGGMAKVLYMSSPVIYSSQTGLSVNPSRESLHLPAGHNSKGLWIGGIPYVACQFLLRNHQVK